jgi:hypothetical protein
MVRDESKIDEGSQRFPGFTHQRKVRQFPLNYTKLTTFDAAEKNSLT